jgi:hypothetical protein
LGDVERQLVHDGLEPDGPIEVDVFECVACGEPLLATLDVHASDELVARVDAERWAERGFELREPLPGMHVMVDADGLRAIAVRATCRGCGARQLALAAAGEWQPQRWVVVACGSAALPDARA